MEFGNNEGQCPEYLGQEENYNVYVQINVVFNRLLSQNNFSSTIEAVNFSNQGCLIIINNDGTTVGTGINWPIMTF